MRRVKLIMATGAAIALVVSLAACGSGGQTESPATSASSAAVVDDAASTDGAAPAPADDASEISGTINWWAYAPDVMVAEAYIKAFNEIYPDVTVVYKNFENSDYAPAMRPALASDQGPDVFAVAPGGAVASKDQFADAAMDMAPLAEATLGAGWKDQFAAGYVDQLSFQGKVVGIPSGGVGAGFLWYNVELFEQYGQKPPTTYQEFADVCKVFNDAGITCFTVGAGGDTSFVTETLRLVVTSIDPTFYEAALKGERSWEEPAMVEAIEIMRKMVDDGIIPDDAVATLQYPDANNAFMSQQAAIVQMGVWYTQYAVEAAAIAAAEGAGVANPTPFTQLWFPSPDFAGKGNYPGLQNEVDLGLAINPKSKNLAAAEAFVKFVTMTPEGQQVVINALDVLPALVGVNPDWDNVKLVNPAVQRPALEDLFAQSMASTETRNVYRGRETSLALLQAVQQTLSTSTAPEAILAELQASAVPPQL